MTVSPRVGVHDARPPPVDPMRNDGSAGGGEHTFLMPHISWDRFSLDGAILLLHDKVRQRVRDDRSNTDHQI